KTDLHALVVAEHRHPPRGRETEAARGIGLVDSELDRLREGAWHAQEGDQVAADVGHADVDEHTEGLSMANRGLDGGMGGFPGNGRLRDGNVHIGSPRRGVRLAWVL